MTQDPRGGTGSSDPDPAEATQARGEIRVGVLGYSLAGALFHAPFVSATPGLRLSAIVTSNPERVEAARNRYPDVTVHPSADELLEAGGVDLVVVATPNDTHVPLARAALEAGLDVVVDKPVAPDAEQARELQARADEAGRIISVYQNRRWDSDYLTLRSVIDSGALGAVRRFESRFESWSPKAKGGWRESGAAGLAGGLLFDLGAHLIDQAVQLFGPVETVTAELDVRRAGVSAEDDVFVALRHRDGVRSHLWMSKVAAHLGHRLRVLGSEAAFVVDGLDPQEAALREGYVPSSGTGDLLVSGRTASVVRGSEVEQLPLVAGDYGGFYSALERAVRERSTPPVRVEESAYVLDVIDAARRSATNGSIERVGGPGA